MKSDIILGALSFEMNYWSNLEQFRNFYCIYCIEMLFIGGGGDLVYRKLSMENK
jgi:hypothetical protein